MKKNNQRSKILFSVLALTISLGMASASYAGATPRHRHASTKSEVVTGNEAVPLVASTARNGRTHSNRSDYTGDNTKITWVKADVSGPKKNDHGNKSVFMKSH